MLLFLYFGIRFVYILFLLFVCFFQSDPSSDFDVAKRSSAFKACLKLYEQGELDDHLMPFNKLRRLKHIDSLYFQHWNQEQFDKGAIICLHEFSLCNFFKLFP